MRILMTTVALLVGSGCVTIKLPGAAEGKQLPAPQQVMVEVLFNEADRILAAPKVMVLDGEEATIEVVRAVDVPVREQPLNTGVILTIRPKMESGRVTFAGNCRVMSEEISNHERHLRSAAFHSREAFFTGTARSGETRRVIVSQSADQALEVTLKFTMMMETAARN